MARKRGKATVRETDQVPTAAHEFVLDANRRGGGGGGKRKRGRSKRK